MRPRKSKGMELQRSVLPVDKPSENQSIIPERKDISEFSSNSWDSLTYTFDSKV